MPRLIRPLAIAVPALAFSALSAILVHAQSNIPPERFTATAVNMNRGAAGVVDISIERWSSDAERDKLMAALMDKGPEKLLDVLQDLPRKGYIRNPSSIGWDIHFARRLPGPDGGERVILVTDRRIGFWEAS